MNRRSDSLKAVGALSRTAFSGSARRSPRKHARPARPKANGLALVEALLKTGRPLEIDLAAPGASDYFRCRDIDAYVRLLEADPADPGEQSGLALHIMEAGDNLCVSASMEGRQPNGTITSHCLGILRFEDVTPLVDAEPRSVTTPIRIGLREFYFDEYAEGLSGATLELIGGRNPEMRVVIGSHIFGVLCGALVTVFLYCLSARCAQAVQ